MNRAILSLIAALLASSLSAQPKVVSWTFESKKLTVKKYEVRFIATIQQPWHIYSTTQAKGGPIPTKITYTKNPLASPEGKIKEIGKMETHYEEVFELDTKFYTGKVEFVQVFRVRGSASLGLVGKIQFMACTNERCLTPQDVPFSIVLN